MKIAVFLLIGLLILMLLFPPWVEKNRHSQTQYEIFRGYHFILSPPDATMGDYFFTAIYLKLLWVQLAFMTLAAIIPVFYKSPIRQQAEPKTERNERFKKNIINIIWGTIILFLALCAIALSYIFGIIIFP